MQSECSYRNLGRFPFHQNFQNFRIGRKWYGNVWRKSLELRGLFDFWKANHSTKKYENSTIKIICNGNPWRDIFENFGIPTEVIIFLEIPKNAVPFRKRMETKPKLIGLVESAFIKFHSSIRYPHEVGTCTCQYWVSNLRSGSLRGRAV